MSHCTPKISRPFYLSICLTFALYDHGIGESRQFFHLLSRCRCARFPLQNSELVVYTTRKPLAHVTPLMCFRATHAPYFSTVVKLKHFFSPRLPDDASRAFPFPVQHGTIHRTLVFRHTFHAHRASPLLLLQCSTL